ncbi:hypothetical protein [Pusillimonas minor]|uniref:DUF1311 domain-containing protein n=1 Tax=Pusillimonas minor TaxID=2697024 RepID=A0A842HLC2_9BURK|nr:hypothetical protein [Pusillimonas minor]MBC2768318.1 hypothetical protein [Pusillimonas minor]
MRIKRFLLTVLATGAAGVLNPVMAQGLSPEAQYQQDLLRCEQEQSLVDIEACKKEAGAALQATKTNALGNGQGANYQANERARCMALPEDQRADCLLLLSGQNTQVKGSVTQGGVLRETTITIPAQPSAPAQAPIPASPEAATPSPIRP